MKYALLTLLLMFNVYSLQAAFPVIVNPPRNVVPFNVKEPAKHQEKRSGVFAILSIVCALSVITSPLGIVFGIIGLGKGRKYKGLATAGLAVGSVMFVLSWGLLLIFLIGYGYI